jgi:hypothetical protein
MMDRQTELHNTLVTEFLRGLYRVYQAGGTYEDVMVVMESLTAGVMHLGVEKHGMKPAIAAGMVEAMIQQAIERFAAKSR